MTRVLWLRRCDCVKFGGEVCLTLGGSARTSFTFLAFVGVTALTLARLSTKHLIAATFSGHKRRVRIAVDKLSAVLWERHQFIDAPSISAYCRQGGGARDSVCNGLRGALSGKRGGSRRGDCRSGAASGGRIYNYIIYNM